MREHNVGRDKAVEENPHCVLFVCVSTSCACVAPRAKKAAVCFFCSFVFIIQLFYSLKNNVAAEEIVFF